MTQPLHQLAQTHAASVANIVAAITQSSASPMYTRKRVSARKRPRPDLPPLRRSERVRRRTSAQHTPDSPESDDATVVLDTTPSRHDPCVLVTESLEDTIIRNVFRLEPTLAPDFLSRFQSSDITASIREVVVDWLMEVASEFGARPHTLVLAVNFMDRVLSKRAVAVANVQLVAIVSMLIACKIEETEPPSVAEIVSICDKSYSASKVLAMEEIVLNTLEYRLTTPTHMSIVSKLAESVQKGAHCAATICQVARFASYMALLDYKTTYRRAGDIAMGCVLLGMWFAGARASHLKGCAGGVSDFCGMSAVDVVLRLVEAWKRVLHTHRGGNSRWLLLKFYTLADKVEQLDMKKLEHWLLCNWGDDGPAAGE